MALVPDGETANVAGWLAGSLAAIAGAWKFFLRGKRDVRDDRADDVTHKGYQDVIDTLREEINRLTAENERLHRRLNGDDE